MQNNIETAVRPRSPQSPVDTTPGAATANRSGWPERITAAWGKQVPAIIETGNLLETAKAELGRGNWMRMARNELPFSVSTANKLMKVAACDHFKDSEFIPKLPAAWSILFALTLLDEKQFESGVQSGAINAGMTMKDAKALRGLLPPEPKPSPMAILKRQIEEQVRKIAHLEEQLAASDGGSLFDLQRDSPKNIASVIVGTISERRASELADAIKAAIKHRSAKQA